MAELRQNMATKEWVLIATERCKRPQEFAESKRAMTHTLPSYDAQCPFCPGNEHEMPTDVLRWPERGAWELRIFPNRYPALQRNGARVSCLDGVQRKLSGVGFHEVLIETPEHNLGPAQQSAEQIQRTLRAFQERGRELMADPRLEQIIFFKNHGPQAGSSIVHPHGQLVALPMVPHTVRRRIEEARRTIDDEGQCPFCKMAQLEIEEKERLVAVNESFVAFVPYAAPSPFHIWILPRRHGPTFLDQTSLELLHLAQAMRLVLAKIYQGLNDPDYNYIIHTAPTKDSSSAYLHWHVSIVPRVTKSAGFELGTGMYINPAMPEESAAFLREQEIPAEVQPVEQGEETASGGEQPEAPGAAPAAGEAASPETGGENGGSARIVPANDWHID